MIAYCGLDCSKCISFIATQSGSQEKIEECAKKWSVQYKKELKPEHVICDGCKASGRKSYYCGNLCEINKCAINKKVDTCAECRSYPCPKLSPVLDNAPEAKANLEQIRKNK